MDEFIKLLDPNLHYLRHEISDEELLIYVESERLDVKCPYCGQLSSRRHSMYERSFQDLPMMGKKTNIILKFLCSLLGANFILHTEAPTMKTPRLEITGINQ